MKTYALLAPFLLAATCALFLGCPSPEGKTAPAPAKCESLKPAPELKADPTAAPEGAISGTYEVVCGCAVKEIGHCGEYALVDGKQVEITGHGLGDMPFCGKPPAQAKIAGELKDGKIAASSIELVSK